MRLMNLCKKTEPDLVKVLHAGVFARGIPAPQPRPRGRVLKKHSGQYTVAMYTPSSAKPWRAAVKKAFIETSCTKIIATPVHLQIIFWFHRPDNHWGTGKNAGILKHRFADPCVIKKPDLDNLLKSTIDAMVEAGVMKDDNLVCSIECCKRFSNSHTPGATINAYTIEKYNVEKHRGNPDVVTWEG